MAWFLSVEKGRRAVISAPGSRCELQKVQAASRSLPSRYTTSRLPPWGMYKYSTVKQVTGSHYSKSLSINRSLGNRYQQYITPVLEDPDPETGVFLPLDPGSGLGIRDGEKILGNLVGFWVFWDLVNPGKKPDPG